MLCIKNVNHKGVPGQFRANADMIGWKSDEGGEPVIHAASSVKQAEWLEGKLRVLCEEEESGSTVLALDGFVASDFDKLWRHFKEHCEVYMKKHQPVATLSEAAFDAAMQSLELSADVVDEAPSGSVQKKSKEMDLLKKVEGVRDGLTEAVKGDKQALNRVFAANGCERIGRLRLVLDTVQIEVNRRDDRWLHLRHMAATVESVLRDLGTFKLWKPTDGDPNSSMARRQMVWELKRRQHGGDENCGLLEEAQLEEPAPTPQQPAYSEVSKLREGLQAGGFNPLAAMANPLAANGYNDPLKGGSADRDAAPSLPPAPAPPPAPAEEPDDPPSEPEEAPAEASQQVPAKYEDEEVADPTHVSAAPPGHQNDMGLHLSEQQRRMNYTRSDSLLEGWVWKRSRFLKNWRRRWLVLTKLQLESMKTRGGKKPTETIEAGTVHRVYAADGEVNMARCFCVASNKRTFFMVCDDEAQKAEWIKQITATLGTRR